MSDCICTRLVEDDENCPVHGGPRVPEGATTHDDDVQKAAGLYGNLAEIAAASDVPTACTCIPRVPNRKGHAPPCPQFAASPATAPATEIIALASALNSEIEGDPSDHAKLQRIIKLASTLGPPATAPSTPSRECFTDSSGLCRNPDWCIHSVPEEMVAEISRLTRERDEARENYETILDAYNTLVNERKGMHVRKIELPLQPEDYDG